MNDTPYEVLARKYRPQLFEEIVGQDPVVKTLTHAIERNRVAHAYLFVGPRGTGKTSIARIFSKALNCLEGTSPTPCNTCDLCREITEGRNLDVLEIDGASNNGVEQVRELRENVRFMPTKGQFKLYIIDEVHMLSTSAFNALLKTLEEPPSHVKFIFATTEVHKVPATILSRCQRFDLRRIPMRLIVQHLKEMAEAENISIEENALIAIARSAEGGMRDAQSALDQLISFQGKKIAEEDVLSVFGLVSHTVINNLAAEILKGNIPGIVECVGELDNAGKDMRRLLFDLLEHFRNILVYMYTKSAGQLVELTSDQIDLVEEQAHLSEPGKISRIVDLLMESENRLRMALSPRILLEMALIRCARSTLFSSIDEIMDELSRLQENVVEKEEVKAIKQVEKKVNDLPPAPASLPQEEIEGILVKWPEMIKRLSAAMPLAKMYMENSTLLGINNQTATIGINPKYESAISKIDHAHNRQIIEKIFSKMLGQEIKVVIKVMECETPEKPPASTLDTKSEPDTQTSQPNKKPKNLRDWQNEPAVRKALEILNGDIQDVKG